jgi:carboxymethylenebutenolidase
MSAVSYIAVATLALGIGAGGAWVAQKVAPARHDAVTTHGEWVKIARGSATIRAYVAYPERKSKAPAVIVIHEIFGLTDWEPTVVDRLAK